MLRAKEVQKSLPLVCRGTQHRGQRSKCFRLMSSLQKDLEEILSGKAPVVVVNATGCEERGPHWPARS